MGKAKRTTSDSAIPTPSRRGSGKDGSPYKLYVQDSVIIGQHALAKTSRLHEEYLVHEMIGKGGFGEV
jgi:hypothetical protein